VTFALMVSPHPETLIENPVSRETVLGTSSHRTGSVVMVSSLDEPLAGFTPEAAVIVRAWLPTEGALASRQDKGTVATVAGAVCEVMGDRGVAAQGSLLTFVRDHYPTVTWQPHETHGYLPVVYGYARGALVAIVLGIVNDAWREREMRPASSVKATMAWCVTPAPPTYRVRESADGKVRVILLPNGGRWPFATYGDDPPGGLPDDAYIKPPRRVFNQPARSLEHVLRFLPRDVTTEPEALVLRVAATQWQDPDYRLTGDLYQPVLDRGVTSVPVARNVVRRRLGEKRYGYLPEELRAALEAEEKPIDDGAPPIDWRARIASILGWSGTVDEIHLTWDGEGDEGAGAPRILEVEIGASKRWRPAPESWAKLVDAGLPIWPYTAVSQTAPDPVDESEALRAVEKAARAHLTEACSHVALREALAALDKLRGTCGTVTTAEAAASSIERQIEERDQRELAALNRRVEEANEARYVAQGALSVAQDERDAEKRAHALTKAALAEVRKILVDVLRGGRR
jgi:hypothetical protein